MKSTKKHFALESGEYLIDIDHPDAENIKVFLNGKNITDTVVGVIRYIGKEGKDESPRIVRRNGRI